MSKTLELPPDSPPPAGDAGPQRLAAAAAEAGPPRRLLALSLRRNFTWAFAGNMVFSACQWANLVVLAKLSDDVTVGRFALALAVTGPVFMLSNLQLRSVQATDAGGGFRFGHYMALRLVGTLMGLLSLPLIILWSGYRWEVACVVFAVGLGKAFDALNDVGFGLVQRHERLDRIARGRLLAGFGSLGGLTLLAALTGELFWAALGWAAGHALTTVLARWWIGRDVLAEESPAGWSAVAPVWELPRLWQLARLALPLGFVMMLVSLYFNVPRYAIEEHLGEETLAVFAGVSYLMVAGHMVVVAAGQAATPRLAKLYAAGERRAFVRLLGRLSLLGAGGGLLAAALSWLAGKPILTLLYRPEYARYDWLLVVLSLVAGVQFVTSFFGEAMTATRRFREQVPLLLVVVGVTWLSCWLLVPTWGLLGAAIATGLGTACQLVGSLLIVGWALWERR